MLDRRYHNQPYPIKQIIALQPSHAYISSFAQILGPLGWCEDGEAHAGIAVCPFGLFFRGSGIAMHADGIYMRRRVDAIRIEEPAMQLKPIAAGDGYRAGFVSENLGLGLFGLALVHLSLAIRSDQRLMENECFHCVSMAKRNSICADAASNPVAATVVTPVAS